MKTIVKIFLIFGILFWGTGLIFSLFKLIALNGLGEVFKMEVADEAKVQVVQDSTDIFIDYIYKVDGLEYRDNYNMFVDYYKRCDVDIIVIKYNKTFPMVSFINGVPLKNRQQKIGVIISSFFILFFLLLWKLSNRHKTAEIYEEVRNRPWLYPDDKTIKNPWKRLKNRFFKK